MWKKGPGRVQLSEFQEKEQSNKNRSIFSCALWNEISLTSCKNHTLVNSYIEYYHLAYYLPLVIALEVVDSLVAVVDLVNSVAAVVDVVNSVVVVPDVVGSVVVVFVLIDIIVDIVDEIAVDISKKT